MAYLTPDQQHDNVMQALGDVEGIVESAWEDMYAQKIFLNDYDPSGEYLVKSLIVDGLDLLLVKAQDDVSNSDGGGQSTQAQQHFEHLVELRKTAHAELERYQRALQLDAGMQVAPMLTKSLTPVQPGQVDPAHPVFSGDPRYGWVNKWW